MIIKIEAFPNGGHSNQSSDVFPLPEGWAFVPDSVEIPDTFPFVDIDVNVVDGVLTVIDMRPGIVPEPEPMPEPAPDPIEVLTKENKLLKAQVELQSEQITFLEDCILEMADEVYA